MSLMISPATVFPQVGRLTGANQPMHVLDAGIPTPPAAAPVATVRPSGVHKRLPVSFNSAWQTATGAPRQAFEKLNHWAAGLKTLVYANMPWKLQ